MLNPVIKKRIFVGISILCVILILFLGSYLYFEGSYDNRIYPGIKTDKTSLGNKTQTEAEKILSDRTNTLVNNLRFIYKTQIVDPGPATKSFVVFNNQETVKLAYNFGRQDNLWFNLRDRFQTLFFGKTIDLNYSLDENSLRSYLEENFKIFESEYANAELEVLASSTSSNTFSLGVKDEKAGIKIDYETGMNDLKNNLKSLNSTPVEFKDFTAEPKILKKYVNDVDSQAEKFLSLSPLVLEYKDASSTELISFKILRQDMARWLGLELAEENKPESVFVNISRDKLKSYLETTVIPKINRDPNKASFEVKNGRVANFSANKDGLELDLEANISQVINNFSQDRKNKLAIIVKKTVNEDLSDVNNLGIKEIIGTGHSNFVGSPKNRRHNISVGSNSVNGTLIKPGEEFSLVKVLGPVEKTTGYLPELVIKENKTIPEYGGGLCQVGTTVFRAALESGLPITSRRNHSYRVSYYEPAGMDAAIYIPQPDVRFINDTGNYILIQVRMVGNDLYFDFWGTKDGRDVNISKPVIYNITKPAPSKTVETLDLKPGEKKCTEKAHNGADAYFDYKVVYPVVAGSSTPEIKEKRFASHYVPWQEVCLVGVAKLSATSTSAVIAPVKNNTSTSTSTPR